MTVAGREVELTATEYELLRLLSLNAGRVVAYDALVRQVWSGRKKGSRQLGAQLRQEAPREARRRRAEPGLDYPIAGSLRRCRPCAATGSDREAAAPGSHRGSGVRIRLSPRH